MQNVKFIKLLLIRLFALIVCLSGVVAIFLGFSTLGSNGHNLSSSLWQGAIVLVTGIGLLFLRKWAVLLILIISLFIGGASFITGLSGKAADPVSLVIIGSIIILPSVLLLLAWKNLKWRGSFWF